MTDTEPRPVYTGTPRPTDNQIDFQRNCLERSTFYWTSVVHSLEEPLGNIQRWHFEDCPRVVNAVVNLVGGERPQTECEVCFYLSTANATLRAHHQIQDARRAETDPTNATTTEAVA